MKDVNEWAQAQFGHANLNDPRRTKRLVTVAARLANKPGTNQTGVTINKIPLQPESIDKLLN